MCLEVGFLFLALVTNGYAELSKDELFGSLGGHGGDFNFSLAGKTERIKGKLKGSVRLPDGSENASAYEIETKRIFWLGANDRVEKCRAQKIAYYDSGVGNELVAFVCSDGSFVDSRFLSGSSAKVKSLNLSEPDAGKADAYIALRNALYSSLTITVKSMNSDQHTLDYFKGLLDGAADESISQNQIKLQTVGSSSFWYSMTNRNGFGHSFAVIQGEIYYFYRTVLTGAFESESKIYLDIYYNEKNDAGYTNMYRWTDQVK